MRKRDKEINRVAYEWANQVRDAAFERFKRHLTQQVAAQPDADLSAVQPPAFTHPGETDAPAA